MSWFSSVYLISNSIRNNSHVSLAALVTKCSTVLMRDVCSFVVVLCFKIEFLMRFAFRFCYTADAFSAGQMQ